MTNLVDVGQVPLVGMTRCCVRLVCSSKPYLRNRTSPRIMRVIRQDSLSRLRRKMCCESVLAPGAFSEIAKADTALSLPPLTFFCESDICHI